MLLAVNGPSGPNSVPVQGIIVDIETGQTLETFNNQQVRIVLLVLNVSTSTNSPFLFICTSIFKMQYFFVLILKQ